MYLTEVKNILSYPLLTLSGGVITLASILVGTTILVIATVIAGFTGRWLRRILSIRGLPDGAQFAASKIVRYGVMALGAVIAANSMGLRLDALLAASAVLAVGIGFGLQNIAQNFISGLILLIEQPVRRGDIIRVGNELGVVEDIGLRATHIITRDQVTIVVPNSNLITEKVINHSRPTTVLRVKIQVGVGYESDPEKVREILLKTAKNNPQVLQEPGPKVRLDGFGDSSLDFTLLFWITNPRDDLVVASELRFAIMKAFAEEKIEIPFPQRDIWVRNREGIRVQVGEGPSE